MASYPKIPEYLFDSGKWLKSAAIAINQIRDGKINSTGSFTLTANQSSTTISDVRCGGESRVFFTPLTANAAAELTSIYIPSATITDGQFVVQHANNANSDKTFHYVLLG